MSALKVEHNVSGRSFQYHEGEQLAHLDYEQHDGSLRLVHTEVPSALEGRGIAGQLVQAALEYARHSKLSVVPACPFVAKYIQKHPEYLELVDSKHRDRLRHA